ncbi:iron complex outermembrane recepter protein [Mucilaginibacter sp. OK268]|uniref:TonB-dependent receptor n=1 Tax=Mucilaginibacter sp. OK268 TaxID=1881048 RepID=UPI00088F0EFF|nr:TonB-dependent receptor [Mucilaginibacter sp. OK268]SDQ00319.1 iron complex outermembrane recepter protein [Mucilaginibacter sp. OK268]
MAKYLHNTLQKFSFLLLVLFITILTAKADDEGVNGKISGFVKTSDGLPAAFVNVSIKGLNKSTMTIGDGSFIFNNIKPGTYLLTTSYIGTKSEEKTVEVQAKQTTTVSFILSESSAQLNEVVISSTKTINSKKLSVGKINVSPMDLPQSVTVIGRDVLDQQQSLRLSDVTKNINGVYLYSARGNTQETFGARGYNFSSTNMFKNGFRINSGVMPEISSLEQVEVLKGSAALLYGNVAPGGILNLVTKKPKFEQGGQVSMTYGSYDLYKPVFDVYGPISSKLAYRVNGTYENAKSFRDNVKSEREYINPSFLYKISDKTQIIVEGDYLNYDFTPDFGTGQINNVIAKVPRNRYLGASWSTGNTKQTTATATINHQINSLWQLSGGLSYQHFDRQYQTTERVLPDTLTGDWARTLNRAKTLEDYYTAQFNITGQFNTGSIKHNILVGVDADWYRNTNYTYVATVNKVSSYLDQNNALQNAVYDKINILDLTKYTQRTDKPTMNPFYNVLTLTNRFGAYFNDLISLSDKVKVLAGLRWSYQYISPTTVSTYYNTSPALAQPAAGKEDKAFSPRVGIVYKPLTNTALFASYSNSFVVNTGTDVNNNPLDPSLLDQYEFGVKNDFLNGNLSVNVTAYRILNNNLAQTAVFQADGVTPNTNTNIKTLTGQTKSDGVELDIAGHPVKGLDILAGYSYTNARYTKTPTAVGSNIAGQPLVNVPKHTANTSLFYTFYNGDLKGFKVGASVYYLGDRTAGNANTVGQTPTSTQPRTRLVNVPGFTTVDASVGYSYKKLSIIGKISNIGNVLNYNVHENYSINPIPPRQFLTTLAYKF